MRRTLVTFVASLAAANPAFASSAPLYEVQVLVFANHLHKIGGHEHWGQEMITPIKGYKKALTPSDTLPIGSQLGLAQSTLASHPHYTILATCSWVQNAVSLRQTKAVRIDNQGNEQGQGKLKGVIRVFQWRLMHVALDLHYTPGGSWSNASDISTNSGTHDSSTSGSSTSGTTYQLLESRHIILRHTNYFDHPKFGVLVRIVPYHGPLQPQG